ncbi:MAG TPA: hypothetical protein VN903_13675 [Polyangia bacterium]|jgi:hypothetical protein|nr:hypothetical protein [Polyangia bacterium]
MKHPLSSSARCIVVVASLLYGCGSGGGANTTGTGGAGGTTGTGDTGGTMAAAGTGGTMAAGGTDGGGTGGTMETSGAGGTMGTAGSGGTIGGTGGRPSGVNCGFPASTRCRTELCGNGVRDTCYIALPADCINTTFTEWCDGADLGTATCASRGLGSGTLRCASDCGFDTSGCSGAQGGSGG